MDTCTITDCTTVKYAKGLCRLHYRRSRPRTPDPRETVSCDTCAQQFDRPKRTTSRWVGTYCSYVCRDFARWGTVQTCDLPAGHWARMYGATCEWEAPAPKRLTFFSGYCLECGASIVEIAHGVPSKWCTAACTRRVAKRTRRAAECGAAGDFRYVDVMRQYQRQGRVCAYCKTTPDGLPEPEHVVPISRGGDNSMTNIVAACHACNSNKSDLTLTEWEEYRAARGLPRVDTALDGPAFSHLVLRQTTRPAHRHAQAA